MSMEQVPAKELMRRLGSIESSLKDISKSLSTMTKIMNRQMYGSMPQFVSPKEKTEIPNDDDGYSVGAGLFDED